MAKNAKEVRATGRNIVKDECGEPMKTVMDDTPFYTWFYKKFQLKVARCKFSADNFRCIEQSGDEN